MSSSAEPDSSSSMAMFAIARSVCAVNVADADRFPRVQVLPNLTAQVDRVAGHDRLAEIVVEILLGVRLTGVERPDAAVSGHRCDVARAQVASAATLSHGRSGKRRAYQRVLGWLPYGFDPFPP